MQPPATARIKEVRALASYAATVRLNWRPTREAMQLCATPTVHLSEAGPLQGAVAVRFVRLAGVSSSSNFFVWRRHFLVESQGWPLNGDGHSARFCRQRSSSLTAHYTSTKKP